MTTRTTSVRPGSLSERLHEVAADLATTINRLIQAAMVNGATEIDTTTGNASVIVTDNGRGAADPRELIKQVNGMTDPGPARLPVLIGRRPMISSRQERGLRWTAYPTDAEMEQGRRSAMTPDTDQRRSRTGTTVLIDLLHGDGTDVERIARDAAADWPARITVDGQPIRAAA